MKEVDLAHIVVEYLRADEWEVYQEVCGHQGRCDIYAVRGRLTWAIEVKKSFSFQVLEQAFIWRPQAHYTSIAAPSMKCSPLAKRICKDYGIGMLQIGRGHIHMELEGEINRRPMVPTLYEEQKTWADAGNARNRYVTPFQLTKRDLIEHVRKYPGVTLTGALEGIEHHYRTLKSARQSIAQWIEQKKIPEIEARSDGRNLRLYPVGG